MGYITDLGAVSPAPDRATLAKMASRLRGHRLLAVAGLAGLLLSGAAAFAADINRAATVPWQVLTTSRATQPRASTRPDASAHSTASRPARPKSPVEHTGWETIWESPVQQTSYETVWESSAETIPTPTPVPTPSPTPAATPIPMRNSVKSAPSVGEGEVVFEGPNFAGVEGGPVYEGPGPVEEGEACAADGSTIGCCPDPYGHFGSPLRNRLWVRGEYMAMWIRGADAPALVTTSPDGTNIAVAGALGQPTTQVLYGDGPLNQDSRSGGRLTLGLDLGACRQWGLMASYLTIGKRDEQYNIQSTGSPIVMRPYSNVDFLRDFGLQTGSGALAVAYPGLIEGSVSATSQNEFHTIEGLLRYSLFRQPCGDMELLMGYRFARFDESLAMSQSGTTLADIPGNRTILAGTVFLINDSFATQNDFQGAEVGVTGRWKKNRWTLDVLMKLALGLTRTQVTIDGTSSMTDPAGPVTPGSTGLMSLSTDLGTYSANAFSVIPELGATIGFQITPRLQISAGYTFLYWSHLARAADQFDPRIYLMSPPAPGLAPRPEETIVSNSLWAQGVSAGLEYRF